jgi:DNA-binding transcriptional MocR family regulator
VFSRNLFGDSVVTAKGWTPDGSGLLILCKLPEGSQKSWALAQITLENGVFVHANCGSFFMDDGAQKYFTLAQGHEWTGGETFDDYC